VIGSRPVRRAMVVIDRPWWCGSWIIISSPSGPSAPPPSESVRTQWSATDATLDLPGLAPAGRARPPAREF
jgi:hypothetical protein